jgi:uncharacterized protein with HEPN domain
MKPDDCIRLRHMADALTSVGRFVSGRRRQDLDNDQMLAYALVHALQILGEVASKITIETRAMNPAIPWAEIIGMRHRLVHAYVDIDFDLVWTTATEAAPALFEQITSLLDRG